MSKLLNALLSPLQLIRRVRAKGLNDTYRRIQFLLHTKYRERKLGISTQGYIPWFELGDNPDSVDYEAVGYKTLDRAFATIEVAPEDVFIDFGCGMGRVLSEAATRPFRRVLGVEFSGELCSAARENIQHGLPNFTCQDIEVVETLAQEYPIPADASVFFFFNPFNGETLDQVIDNIHRSLQQTPRDAIIVYVYPRHVTDKFQNKLWLNPTLDTMSEGLHLRVYRSQAQSFQRDVEAVAAIAE